MIILKNKGLIAKTTICVGSGEVITGTHSEIRHNTVIEMNNGTFEIGENSIIGYFSAIQCSGHIHVGNGTLIGPHCTILASSHPTSLEPLITQPLIRGKITIGNNVWIGANCTINYNVNIGDNVIIGANSFVNRDIPENTIYAGSPAKFLRDRL